MAVCVDQGLKAAWYLPDECQLRNPWHLRAWPLLALLEVWHCLKSVQMTELQIEQGQVVGVLAGDRRLAASQVCICSGAWARLHLEQIGMPTGIMPVRGQMVLYHCTQPLLQRIVNEGNRYLVPRGDGRLLAGSVEEEVGYRIETTDDAIAQIRGWAEGVLPQLKTCEVESQWAGLRPGSYDGFPYLGSVPGISQLFVAAGHYRSGLHLSCATAQIMADCMQGQASPIDLRPFRVGRR